MTDFPALNGETVTERHARICREQGHATHTVDGVDSGVCPRCGEVTEVTADDIELARAVTRATFETVPAQSKDAQQAGIRHGWDAANYADAYGTDEPNVVEAQRRARDYYSTSEECAAYADGFVIGWDRFDAHQWQDGTPMSDDTEGE